MENPKLIKDCSELISQEIPPILKAFNENPSLLNNSIEKLLVLEKTTRLSADAFSTAKVAETIIKLLAEQQEYDLLNKQIVQICRKRSQMSEVARRVITTGMEFISLCPSLDIKIKLIQTLRESAQGKIFVELEWSRLTKILSNIEEEQGHINEACDLLQEIQVETVGSMEKKEKAEYLLEQIRLTLVKGDYFRTEMLTQKLNMDTLDEEGFENLFLKCQTLLIKYHLYYHHYFQIYQHFYKIYLKLSNKSEIERIQSFKNVVIYLLLTPYQPESYDIMLSLQKDKTLALPQLSHLSTILSFFLLDELITKHSDHHCFQEIIKESVFTDEIYGKVHLKDFQKRIIQHNLRVIAKTYHRITMDKLCLFLELDKEETENALMEMVTDYDLYLRIDRPKSIVEFSPPFNPLASLNQWSQSVEQLLSSIDHCCYHVAREYMKVNIAPQ